LRPDPPLAQHHPHAFMGEWSMATVEMLKPWVEKTVAEYLGLEEVILDSDGDIPIRTGSAMIYVRLFDVQSGPVFRVFSPVIRGVEKTPELLEKLNELNRGSVYARYFWLDQAVMCSLDYPADTLVAADVTTALNTLSWNADHYDDELKTHLGGSRMVEEEAAPATPPAEGATPPAEDGQPPGDGSYL
jgi:hypothetical protein